ncbi:hypothetical protein Syun_028360 [Stephania yunnanensis]|uniref:Uncharacterized protein n=1 Tax=Stephania yunnanensis TaxID=152371 RepID=A0AAP0HNQ8_9MAGN
MAEAVAKDRVRDPVKCTDRDSDLVMQRDKDMDMVHLDRDFNVHDVALAYMDGRRPMVCFFAWRSRRSPARHRGDKLVAEEPSPTDEEWLKKLDDNIDPAKTIITKWLGSEDEAVKWINQWIIGFMHGIEQGKFNNGEEWMVLRGDGGTPITDRESSCVGVRRTCAALQVIVSRAVTSYLRRSPVGGLRRLVPGRGAQKRRAVLGPPRYGEATGSIMPVAGVQPKGLSDERGGRGGHGSEQGRQHDVTCSTPFTSSMIRVRRRCEEEIGEEEWRRERGRLILGLKMKNRRS